MATSPQATQANLGGPDTGIFGGFGALLGYIGAEAATSAVFEQLLWPQRAFAGFNLTAIPWLALLLPMGGPLHKVALKCLDKSFAQGLFKGPGQGHMLDTSFFACRGGTYTLHGNDAAGTIGAHNKEAIRNSLWTTAVLQLPVPQNPRQVDVQDQCQSTEKSMNSSVKSTTQTSPVHRAKFAVAHLTLVPAIASDRITDLPLVSEHVGSPSLRIFAGLIATEATAIVLSVTVAAAYRTTWSLFFLVPLILRLASAALCLHREPLSIHSRPDALKEPHQDFEVHCPAPSGHFMVITGPPSTVHQFFRHYGHPIRNRFRELAQIAIVVLFGCYFPAGLLCSVSWMPLIIQYVWLSYQIYIVVAMHFIRFTSNATWASTEERIVEVFDRQRRDGQANPSLLFGQSLQDPGLVKATLNVGYVNKYSEGKECMENLLSRNISA